MQKTEPKQLYEKKRKKITVSFNSETEQHLLAHAKAKKDFSKWVKHLIEQDIEKVKNPKHIK